MAEQNEQGVYQCKHCGLTSPLGHWRPNAWMEKHEANCPRNPKNNQAK